jgi:hypothetical protein
LLEAVSAWLQRLLDALLVGEPLAILVAVQIATLALSLAAILLWRFRYREKVIYVRDMAGVEASEAAEDLSSAMLVVFTDQGRVVAASGIDGGSVAPFVREALSHLAELGMDRVSEMRVWGSNVVMTVARVSEVGERAVYAAAIRPGARAPDGRSVRMAVERQFADVVRGGAA